jgi:hypothetical protein
MDSRKAIQKQYGLNDKMFNRPEEDPNYKITRQGEPELEPEAEQAYRVALTALNESGITYAVGATFARHAYTGIWRRTKDLDIFIKPEDLKTTLKALRDVGFETEVVAEHWLAKGYKGEHFVDIIFSNAHGHHPIDDRSFEGSQEGEVVGVKTYLIPIEEIIASTAYVAERRRFDGGEIVHLIKCSKGRLDWERILERLGEDRELLFWHLVLFDFIYPGHSDYLPLNLMVSIFDQMRRRWQARRRKKKAFRGTLIDPFLFAVDIDAWGYDDPRILKPLVDKRG